MCGVNGGRPTHIDTLVRRALPTGHVRSHTAAGQTISSQTNTHPTAHMEELPAERARCTASFNTYKISRRPGSRAIYFVSADQIDGLDTVIRVMRTNILQRNNHVSCENTATATATAGRMAV